MPAVDLLYCPMGVHPECGYYVAEGGEIMGSNIHREILASAGAGHCSIKTTSVNRVHETWDDKNKVECGTVFLTIRRY